MSQSSSSTEADTQLAFELNRQLNANNRRAAVPSTPAKPGPSKVYQAKFTQDNGVVGSQLPPTPISLVTTPVPTRHGPKLLSSSPLSSLSSLDDDFPNEDKPTIAVGCVSPYCTKLDIQRVSCDLRHQVYLFLFFVSCRYLLTISCSSHLFRKLTMPILSRLLRAVPQSTMHASPYLVGVESRAA